MQKLKKHLLKLTRDSKTVDAETRFKKSNKYYKNSTLLEAKTNYRRYHQIRKHCRKFLIIQLLEIKIW